MEKIIDMHAHVGDICYPNGELMEKIIDMHSHLGDICYPNGGALIEKKGIKKNGC